MEKDFLNKYVGEYVETKIDNYNYDISEKDIKSISNELLSKSVIWETLNNEILNECEKYKKQIGLLKDRNGSFIYKTELNTYSLLVGKDSQGLNSDILFIYCEPLFIHNTAIPGEVVDFIYGGFSEDNLKELDRIIRNYEMEKYV